MPGAGDKLLFLCWATPARWLAAGTVFLLTSSCLRCPFMSSLHKRQFGSLLSVPGGSLPRLPREELNQLRPCYTIHMNPWHRRRGSKSFSVFLSPRNCRDSFDSLWKKANDEMLCFFSLCSFRKWVLYSQGYFTEQLKKLPVCLVFVSFPNFSLFRLMFNQIPQV